MDIQLMNLGWEIGVGILLGVVAYIDLKHKKVPAIISSVIIVALMIRAVISLPNAITYGLLTFAFAWFLYDLDFFRGIADFKALLIIGLTLTTLKQFGLMIVLLSMIAFTYQFAYSRIIKTKKKEIPFVPVFFLTYVTLWGVIILT